MRNSAANEPFEAAYAGQTVVVYGLIRTDVMRHPPWAEVLTVNRAPWLFTRSGDHITFGVGQRVYLSIFQVTV